jgi:rare lipoprotein A (peptidoglycan hydrolase)
MIKLHWNFKISSKSKKIYSEKGIVMRLKFLLRALGSGLAVILFFNFFLAGESYAGSVVFEEVKVSRGYAVAPSSVFNEGVVVSRGYSVAPVPFGTKIAKAVSASAERSSISLSGKVVRDLSGADGVKVMVASWYGYPYHGKKTSSGEVYNMNDMTAAHKTLPFGTRLKVIYKGKSVEVRINDRGPFIPGRHLDLSREAAKQLGIIGPGVDKVQVEILSS